MENSPHLKKPPMPRPATPLGTWGKITVKEVRPGCWEAKARYRDWDGVSRLVEANGTTKAKAENNFKERLAKRTPPSSGPITKETRLSELWDKYREALVANETPLSTLDAYDSAAKKIKRAHGGLRLGECNPLMFYNFLLALTPSVAHHCRSVLSGMFEHAITAGAVDRNVVKDVPSVAKAMRKKRAKGRTTGGPRSLEPVDAKALMRQLKQSDIPCPPVKEGEQQSVKGYCPTVSAYAQGADLVDVVVMFAGTGLRIGELLGILWSDVDLKEKTLRLSGKVTRGAGRGLVREDYTKTEAGERTIPLPQFVIDTLTDRKKRQALSTPHGFVSATKIQKGAELLPLVFPAANGSLRDPRNTQRQWRRVRAALDLNWVVSHTFRKTVASVLDDEGLTARAAADQLGHAQVSTTQNVYYGRGKIRREVAEALDKNIG